MEGVDYSFGRPNIDQLWSAGKRFVVRYLAYRPNRKVLSASELAALRRRGFGVVLNWEQAAGDMFKGHATGMAHASEAKRQASELGAPASTPIYFSCDKDVTSAGQMTAVAAYLDGCAAVLGRNRVGIYAEYAVIEALVPGKAAWGWQTYAWSGGRVSGKAHFLQYKNGVNVGGADVDLNRSLKSSFGAWWPDGSVDTGGDVAFTPEQETLIVDAARSLVWEIRPWLADLSHAEDARDVAERARDAAITEAITSGVAGLTDAQVTAIADRLADATGDAPALRTILREELAAIRVVPGTTG